MITGITPITFAIFYCLEASHRSHHTQEARIIQKCEYLEVKWITRVTTGSVHHTLKVLQPRHKPQCALPSVLFADCFSEISFIFPRKSEMANTWEKS